MGKIAQAMRDAEWVENLITPQNRKMLTASELLYDEFGNIFARKAVPFKTPLTFHWNVTDGERKRVARAGKLSILATHADTMPTTGQLIVRLYQETATSGETQILTLYHPKNQRMYEERPLIDILEGSWLSVDIQSAGGASNVSVSAVVDVG